MKKKTLLTGENNSIAGNENDKESSRSHETGFSKQEPIFHYEDMVWVFPSGEKELGRRINSISFKRAEPAMVASLKSFALKQLERGIKISSIDIVVKKLSRLTHILIAQYGDISKISSSDILGCIHEQIQSPRLRERALWVLCLYFASLKEDGVHFLADIKPLKDKMNQLRWDRFLSYVKIKEPELQSILHR